ncbi:unnamed protein product, partial [Mesorhabditis belari]|uniref:Uncharacterized protein n=1 Tax=Mesorhabditis belari TaxID=2138241 RepID=A0AAF3J4S4_9BILA
MSIKNWTRTIFKFNDLVEVSLYRSSRTRLQVAVGNVPGPMVKGVISFVTEADNNDGLPHTLEHLVFMGSKKYPYKGVLDIIANRCLASGTNAWTDQDHTAYTLSTVGSEGFFKVLPIYLNHLLDPSLTNEQFLTEVHHINGQGEDGGVVYSEMQDHESEMETIVHVKAQRLLYPENNPYGVNTGGELKYLRETCSIDKCRDYHKKFYHLQNMLVSVAGTFEHERLLEIMSQIEESYLEKIPSAFAQPFSFTLPPIAQNQEVYIPCPADDPTRGIVEIHWFGPNSDEHEVVTALHILFDYMENTAVSPLQKDFVLISDPFASNATFSVNEQKSCVITLSFQNVPSNKIREVAKKFFDKTYNDHLVDDAFDLPRMNDIIEQHILSTLAKAENKPHDAIFGHLIGHQLYGENRDDLLLKRLDEIATLRRLKKEDASFWVNLWKKHLSQPYVLVGGLPDEKLIADKETQRIDEQKKKLGSDGLKQKEKDLNDATKKNTESKPPQVLLDELIVQQLEKFARFKIDSLEVSKETQKGDLEKFPLATMLHLTESKFFQMYLLLDTLKLSDEQKKWLMLFTELMFDSPAYVDGQLWSAEDVAKMFTKDLVDSARFSNLAKWGEIFTKGIHYDAKRIKMIAQRLASLARESKRDGVEVASSLIASLCYEKGSTTSLYDTIVLEKFHERVVELCDSNPDLVASKLSELRSVLLDGGVNIHLVGDTSTLKTPNLPIWESFKKDNASFFKVPMGESVICGKQPEERNVVIGVGGSESSFIYQTAVTGVDWLSPELVPIMLLTQYLSQTEGPLWRAVRGDGLAYGANIYTKPDRKTVTLSLYRCADPVKAYERTKEVVEGAIAAGKLDKNEFEAAKRSLIFELIQKEDGISNSARERILGQFRGTGDAKFINDLCAKIWDASVKDVLDIGGPIISKLFKDYSRAVTIHPSKVKNIRKHFGNIVERPISSLSVKPDF